MPYEYSAVSILVDVITHHKSQDRVFFFFGVIKTEYFGLRLLLELNYPCGKFQLSSSCRQTIRPQYQRGCCRETILFLLFFQSWIIQIPGGRRKGIDVRRFFFIYEASDSDFFSVGYGSTRSFGTNLGASRHGFLEHASTRSSKSPNKLLVNDARWRPHKSTRDSAFEIVMDAIL
jgi:hypothetical protein